MRWMLVAALAFSVTPAGAETEKQAECARQADLVMQIVTARSEGARQARAERLVRRGLTGEMAKYADLVDAVAQWVYSLPGDQLGNGVGAAWESQCRAAL